MSHVLALYKEEKCTGKIPLICISICVIGLLVLASFNIVVGYHINSNNSEKVTDNDLVVVLETDKLNYQVGEPVHISIYVENHGATNVSFVFHSSLFGDYRINEGPPWSYGKYFIQTIFNFTLPSGGRLYLLNDTWNQGDSSGHHAPPGAYSIFGWMVETSDYPKIYAEPVYIWIGTRLQIETHAGLGAGVSITNVGVFNATNVTGNVSVRGGYFGHINLSKSFDVDNLVVNKSIFTTLFPFGLGPITIEISATSSTALRTELNEQLFVFLFLVR
ncbi:MAG TPA: BsuPI-related putative proteinase inhibitor [Candidatus Thermoplasmatota archaeon]|nr:BsuPI-related putative proteinase inhibitor [Candidatus Thermoplasmatota archaeon]